MWQHIDEISSKLGGICQDCDESSTVQDKLDFLDYRFRELDYELGSQKEKNSELEKSLQETRQTLQETRQDLNIQKGKNSNLTSRLGKLEAKYDLINAKNEELQHDLKELQVFYIFLLKAIITINL